MKLHPATHIAVAVEVSFLVIALPFPADSVLLALLYAVVLLIPARTGFRRTMTFMKVLAAAALFLALIHAVRWTPVGLSADGIATALKSFNRIAVPFAGIIYLSKTVSSEELFALLVDMRVPPPVILILFRTVWLVPRLMGRTDEVLAMQRMRGLRIESPLHRLRAVLPTLSPIFSSMIDEISQNSLTITARGFLSPGRKSHLLAISFSAADAAVVGLTTLVCIVLWCLKPNI